VRVLFEPVIRYSFENSGDAIVPAVNSAPVDRVIILGRPELAFYVGEADAQAGAWKFASMKPNNSDSALDECGDYCRIGRRRSYVPKGAEACTAGRALGALRALSFPADAIDTLRRELAKVTRVSNLSAANSRGACVVS